MPISKAMMKPLLTSVASRALSRRVTPSLSAFERTRTCNNHDACSFSSVALKSEYEYIKVETRLPEEQGRGVGLVTLHRPKALNALCDGLFDDLIHATKALDADDTIGCTVLTGSTKAFAAGADISEMKDKAFHQVFSQNMFAQWADITTLQKPLVAAVNGYCLGGGCELAMMCDIMVCSDTAKFGQPEINLGVIPGAGGTQRLLHAIGKAKAMHMVLTGEMMNAQQAYDAGLVAKVFKSDELLDEAVTMAKTIASKSHLSTIMAKEAVNAALELPLKEGLRLERRLFHALFATHDQKEGMTAFLEKRVPDFKHK